MDKSISKTLFTGKYIRDIIYGANDGIVTTFAVIAGTTGASLTPLVTIIVGFANIFADGLSMGASDFLGIKSEKYFVKAFRKKELWEIGHDRPEGEKEVRDVFSKRGFKGEDLERAVQIVTSNKKAWLETMMRDEWGVIDDPKDDPKSHGVVTFIAFSIAGFFPIIPYLIPNLNDRFLYSAIIGGLTLFTVGSLRALVTAVGWLRGGMEMLFIGTIASVVAFLVGSTITTFFLF